jgi:hypothetical protein
MRHSIAASGESHGTLGRHFGQHHPRHNNHAWIMRGLVRSLFSRDPSLGESKLTEDFQPKSEINECRESREASGKAPSTACEDERPIKKMLASTGHAAAAN